MLLKALRTDTADDAAEIMSAHLLRTLDAIKSARARGRLSRPAASGL